MCLEDLVKADFECFILRPFLDEIFVNPELCCCDGLSLWNTGEVKAEFSPVVLVEKFRILVNCENKSR